MDEYGCRVCYLFGQRGCYTHHDRYPWSLVGWIISVLFPTGVPRDGI